MNFFDYLFHKMKWWNTKVVFDFSPFFSAIIIVAVFQGFNIQFALNFLKYYWGFKINFLDKYFFLSPLLLIIWNFLYFRSPDKQAVIEEKVMHISKRGINIYNIFVVLYFALSLFLFIWSAILLRQQK
jgi:hypothetical protein